MAHTLKRHRSERIEVNQCMPTRLRVLSLLTMIIGPILLIYLTLRCEKNQCILFQLPLVIPTHFGAYWSPLAMLIVLSFIGIMFLLSSAAGPIQNKTQLRDTTGLSTGISSLMATSLLVITLAYLKPEYIHIVHGEYLRMLVTTTMICILISVTLFLLTYFEIIEGKDRELCTLMAFFYGNNTLVNLGRVELKYFFYVHVGLVAWGLLNLLIVLNVAIEHRMTAPLAFLMVSHFLVIGHTLLYENFIHTRPFVTTEGLGFFWLMRVLMYLPFFHSLPLYYAATTEIVLSKPAILADCVFFWFLFGYSFSLKLKDLGTPFLSGLHNEDSPLSTVFGFVIYISSIHQRENFNADPRSFKKLKSITAANGKRLLVSGYWGIVQKPDYLGYIVIWTSWTVACGFSGLSIIVLLVILGTVYMWLRQSSQFKREQFGPAWNRYITQVPKQIIPHVY